MVFVLLVGDVDQLLNDLVVLPALVDNGAEVLAHHVPDDQFLWCEVPKAVLKPADMSEGCPTTDGLDGVASQLGDHLHRHQVGVGACQLFQQALVALHHPLRVGNGGVDKRPGLAAADGDAEGVRVRIPPAQEGNGIPGADGVLVGGLSVAAAGDHPVVEIVLGDTLADVAEFAELFLGNFLGITLECLLKGCFVQHGTHLVRYLANGRGDLLTGVLSFFSPIFSPKRKFLSQIGEKSDFFRALAPAVPDASHRTGNA